MNAKKAKSIRRAVQDARLPQQTFETVIYDYDRFHVKVIPVVLGRYTLPVNHERRIRREMSRTGKPVADVITRYRQALANP